MQRELPSFGRGQMEVQVEVVDFDLDQDNRIRIERAMRRGADGWLPQFPGWAEPDLFKGQADALADGVARLVGASEFEFVPRIGAPGRTFDSGNASVRVPAAPISEFRTAAS